MNWLRAYAAHPYAPVVDRTADTVTTIETRSGAAPCDESAADECYRLISIDSVRAPEDCVGSDWHRYRIAQGENGITGYRCGDLARVTVEVEAIVTALNERREWKKAKASSKSKRPATVKPQRSGSDPAPDEL